VFVIPQKLKGFSAQRYYGASDREWETSGYIRQYVVVYDVQY
jgi:hypothetical protein